MFLNKSLQQNFPEHLFLLITLESFMCLYSRSFGNRQQNILESSVIFWSEISRNRNVLGGFQAIA